MSILITGFEPFGGHDINPSAELAKALRGRAGMVAEVLPTTFDGAAARVVALIEQTRPSVVLMFGVHGEASRPRLERIALNFDHAEIADNAGEWRQSCTIRPDGPIALETRLDVLSLRNDLAARGTAVDISHHAGTYVCNHTYYRALDQLHHKGQATPCLFIHVPQFKDKPDESLLSLIRLTEDLIDLINPSF